MNTKDVWGYGLTRYHTHETTGNHLEDRETPHPHTADVSGMLVSRTHIAGYCGVADPGKSARFNQHIVLRSVDCFFFLGFIGSAGAAGGLSGGAHPMAGAGAAVGMGGAAAGVAVGIVVKLCRGLRMANDENCCTKLGRRTFKPCIQRTCELSDPHGGLGGCVRRHVWGVWGACGGVSGDSGCVSKAFYVFNKEKNAGFIEGFGVFSQNWEKCKVVFISNLGPPGPKL